MIWNIFRTLVVSALFASAQGYGAPSAMPCVMGEKDPTEVSEENFTVKVADQSDVLVLSVFQSSRAQWMMAGQALSDETSDFYEAMQRVSQLYQKGMSVSNVNANVLYLTDRLLKSSVDFVVLDQPLEAVAELQRLAHMLYAEDMVYQFRYRKTRDETMTHLIQLIVGAPIFLKTYQPQLFEKVQLISGPSIATARSSIPIALPATQPEAKPVLSVGPSEVEKKREQMRSEFRANARTLQDFNRFVAKFQNGQFDKGSSEEVRSKILVHFWSPAKPKLREWIDVELAARRRGNVAASVETPPVRVATKSRNLPSVNQNYSIAETILGLKGRGIVFVPRERFKVLKDQMTKICNPG